MNDIAVAVPYWPESKTSYKPKRKLALVNTYIYPTLFFFYFIALWLLFGVYRLLLNLSFQLYIMIKKFEQQRLKKRIVIVGGGYAGTYAAKMLEHNFLVTLIDSKDYFEFTPSKLRILVEPQHSDRVQIKHKHFLSKTLIVVDMVKKITPDFVITDTQSISYDYLIICSGSRTPDIKFRSGRNTPYDKNEISALNSTVITARAQHIEGYNSLLKSSQSVLIIGGGTVGVELAGEIIENFKDKEITIVHSSSALMPRSPQRAINYTEDYFKRNGTNLIFNDKVSTQEGNRFVTNGGKVIEADLAFLCTGNVPNSEFLQNEYFADHLNAYGFVKVNTSLQLEGHPNIFVAGDLTYIPDQEEKLCQTAAAEMATVIRNIYLTEASQPLKTYTPGKCPMLVSLGKYDGLFMYNGFVATGFVPAAMKEFVEWKEMIYYWNWNHFQKSLNFSKRAQEQWSSHAHIV